MVDLIHFKQDWVDNVMANELEVGMSDLKEKRDLS